MDREQTLADRERTQTLADRLDRLEAAMARMSRQLQKLQQLQQEEVETSKGMISDLMATLMVPWSP